VGAPLICVIEDEDVIAGAVAARLRAEGFVVEIAADGPQGVALCERVRPDLVVLDLMLPGLDGLEVCRRMRASGNETPVIFLTARDSSEDKVQGLTGGGDDYVTKPFDLDELVARINAVLKRTAASATPSSRRHEYEGLALDEDAHRVWLDGDLVALSPTEFRLLRYLLVNAERVVSKSQILSHVWGFDYDGDPGVVETYVFYLRRKLGDAGTRLIHTVRGVGYSLRVE